MYTCALCPGKWFLVVPCQYTAMIFWTWIQLYITWQLQRKGHTLMTSPKYRNTIQVTKTWAFVAVLTLALMMVGRGSSIPCIFLNAGMTKRLQVTTADTGLPERERRDDCWGEDYGCDCGVQNLNCGSVVYRKSVLSPDKAPLMSIKQQFTPKI